MLTNFLKIIFLKKLNPLLKGFWILFKIQTNGENKFEITGLTPCLKWAGIIKKTSRRLATRTAHTTAGIANITWPIIPLIKKRGRNAATVVSIAEITGGDILVAARIDEFDVSIPLFSSRCSECSPTTIASSTTIPKAIIRPNKEIILIDWPVRSITANVAENATGIPKATQNAVLEVKKIKRTVNTIINPLVAFLVSRFILSDIRLATVPNCSSFKLIGKLNFFSLK